MPHENVLKTSIYCWLCSAAAVDDDGQALVLGPQGEKLVIISKLIMLANITSVLLSVFFRNKHIFSLSETVSLIFCSFTIYFYF